MSEIFDASSRLRFAPSPTGYLHVGGVRTALYNWLLAKQCGGTFILRIEDTDLERSTEASVQAILEGMRWIGLDWDEGPYFQTHNVERHRQVAQEMVEHGHAYPCFCSQERLDEARKKAKSQSEAFVYDGTCRELSQAEVQRRMDAGEPYVIRFRVNAERTIVFEDMIGGTREFRSELIGDFVIIRADGSPIFHLGVVVDDHDMGVTHIIRGDDHVSNTPRQIMLFEAMGWAVPHYGHLPMIQAPDRTLLSKRHGAVSVLEFEREGILPDALSNFLALLGWSYDANTEIMTRQELIDRFSINRVNRSPAVFDREKLMWMNGVYLRQGGLDSAVDRARDFFIKDGVPENKLQRPWFDSIVALELERSRTLKEMREHLDYFLVDTIESYDQKGIAKYFSSKESIARLEALEAMVIQTSELDARTPDPLVLETELRRVAESTGDKFGNYVHPLRLALTGRLVSPGIFEVLIALGRKRAIDRIQRATHWAKHIGSNIGS